MYACCVSCFYVEPTTCFDSSEAMRSGLQILRDAIVYNAFHVYAHHAAVFVNYLRLRRPTFIQVN